jgi:hypothetical protein
MGVAAGCEAHRPAHSARRALAALRSATDRLPPAAAFPLSAGYLVSIDSYMNLQLASTEEYIDGQFTGNLGEVLIR